MREREGEGRWERAVGRGTIESGAKRAREWGERGEREKKIGVIVVRESGVRERVEQEE